MGKHRSGPPTGRSRSLGSATSLWPIQRRYSARLYKRKHPPTRSTQTKYESTPDRDVRQQPRRRFGLGSVSLAAHRDCGLRVSKPLVSGTIPTCPLKASQNSRSQYQNQSRLRSPDTYSRKGRRSRPRSEASWGSAARPFWNYQTVSLDSKVNSHRLCFLAAMSSCRHVEALCRYCYN